MRLHVRAPGYICLIGASLLLAETLPPNTWPQADDIIGIVIDEARHPLSGVEVILNRRDVRAVTGPAGVFRLSLLPTDSTIAFRRIGYRPIIFAVRPLPPHGDTLLIALEPSAVVLPEIIVSAPATKPIRYAFTLKYDDVFRRQRIGLGRLVTRESIDARLGASTDQLLDGIAGIHVWNGPPKRIRFARCQEPGGIAIFINGVRQNTTAAPDPGAGVATSIYKPPGRGGAKMGDMEPEVEILSRINPAEIEMIEVFPGASEIPGEFHWNGCAVIAIWTREN
jgi:hypothetical protein